MGENPNRFWQIPNLNWNKIAIVGGGPSLTNVDWDYIRDLGREYHFIGANAAYKLGHWIEYVIFGDKKFWDWNKKEISHSLISQNYIAVNENLIDETDLLVVKRLSLGWVNDRTKRSIAWNCNSGAAAVNLAALLGAKKIILLGFDMKLSFNGNNNWHQYHKVPIVNPMFCKFIHRFKYVEKGCKEMNIEVINTNPESELPYFPKMTIEEAFKNA